MSEIENLKQEVIDMCNDSHWKHFVSSTCQVCGVEFEDDIFFKITKQINGELLVLAFHYECAFEPDYASENKTKLTQGVM